ncbi:MAG TPA: rRNA maturation RNase YbeY [Bacteroidia bacterium]|jgi:probable rRNA maturation factor|nr:rRNA maturation RNase YbeY [Bacteroidia bacterium]
MAINFSNDNIVFNLKQKTKLKIWIKSVIKKEKYVLGNLNYTFVSDRALLKINNDFLKHNTYTDIITFNYNEGKKVLGDIFISIDRVKENAQKFDVSFEEELQRVIIHGVLHLCGYKDKSKSDSDLMRKKENQSLKMLLSPKKG